MSLQIAKIIIYSHAGDARELVFNLGGLSILTGASKTGKSAIIDIIDYCTGRAECNIADGVIRKHVSWYAVVFQLNEGQILVARRGPAVGAKASPDVYVERGSLVQTPHGSALFKNTTVNALEAFLSAAIGISENEHRPTLPTRDPLEANFRHALLFSFQDQNDIDSKKRLFHRQGEDFVGQAIKDTLPYFLGAVDEDRLLKQAQLDQARRQLRQLERQLRDAESADDRTFPRARALFDEAKQVGLIDERSVALAYEDVMLVLGRIATGPLVESDRLLVDGEDVLASLRAERQGLRSEMERVHAEIRAARTFTSESSGYEREVKEQRARLSTIGLIVASEQKGAHCPVCESELAVPHPTVLQIERSLNELSEQLEAVEAENPRLQTRLAQLLRQEVDVEQALRENQRRISARTRENEVVRVQQDTFVLQARTVGKITQYVETARAGGSDSELRGSVEAARSHVAALESELDVETVRDRISAFLNIIGRYMTEYATKLDLEHRGSQLRLDIRNLTVVADTLDGPVPLHRMGSGENWVGYHVLAHLSLHKWFRTKRRPVPSFIIFDQPSQAHYPPEQDSEGSLDVLSDEDKTAVHKLFALIAHAAKELAPHLQIIVMDHADLREPWFASAVTERWRGPNRKLVPTSWLE